MASVSVSRRPTTLTTERNPGQSFPVLRYSMQDGSLITQTPAVLTARAPTVATKGSGDGAPPGVGSRASRGLRTG